MTDITELAQSLKAAADREMICRDGAETSEIWERTVTPENILALVEALEEAQQERDNWRTSFDNERFRADKLKAHIDEMTEEQTASINELSRIIQKEVKAKREAEKHIAELESRAVTVENLQDSAYRAGLTAGWNLGLANNNDGFNKCLAAHTTGIKVEAE
ncbi:hypothetical protein [Klebsiella pneumoniae]|uniref:hypothetical protein n=1 Tax=Klebsiella pneumoniae TaxID=573 RepID=UPI001CBB841E|nr:hypothetical protein [Klebsiella pneumoniae]MBZ1582656.1 hypothetical protein [Klebsiella pneumoniae]